MTLTSIPDNISVPEKQRWFADAFLMKEAEKFKSVNPKVCIHWAGIPGSGKTSKLHEFVARHPEWKDHPFVIIGNDNVMQEMPDFQQSVRDNWPEKAFAEFELPARAIWYEFLRQTVSSGSSMILDHSATAGYRPNLLRELKDVHGYHLVMVHVHCSVEEALRRSIIREQETGRHVPHSYFPERQEILERLLPVYKWIVNDFHTIDNSKQS